MYSQRPIRIPCCTRMENPPIFNRIFYAQIAKMYDNKCSVSVDAHAAVCYYYNDLMEKLRPDSAEN